MSARKTLAEEAVLNPFRFFSLEEVGEICGFGRNTMTALVDAGAPVVGRKMNPNLLLEWLKQNHDAIGKVRPE